MLVQDLFISHASADKPKYIQPLTEALAEVGITFWLDSLEIDWGDNVPMKINQGLHDSRFVLVCLSSNFLKRRWPESEMSAALAMQTDSGVRRLLPLLLNSKARVLLAYPLLSAIAYREFKEGPDRIATDISSVLRTVSAPQDGLKIIVESLHSGKVCNLTLEPGVSVGWLVELARRGLGVEEFAETGAAFNFKIRWVLVDARAVDQWIALPRSEKRRVRAVVASEDGLKYSYSDATRLKDIGVYIGIVFRLFAIEDEDYLEQNVFRGFASAIN